MALNTLCKHYNVIWTNTPNGKRICVIRKIFVLNFKVYYEVRGIFGKPFRIPHTNVIRVIL